MDAVFTGGLALVSRATIAPPMESPTNSTPSGPKVSAPADLRSALPAVSTAAASTGRYTLRVRSAIMVVAPSTIAARTRKRSCIFPPQMEIRGRKRSMIDQLPVLRELGAEELL